MDNKGAIRQADGMDDTLLHLAGWGADASSVILMLVTLNQRLFRRFAQWPYAWPVVGLACLGVGTEAATWLAHCDQWGWLRLAWESAAVLMDAGFVVTVLVRLRATSVQVV